MATPNQSEMKVWVRWIEMFQISPQLPRYDDRVETVNMIASLARDGYYLFL